jgi:hypothetical protein
MVETAAHLVDPVFPRVPVRQWVGRFPWPLRLLFAARPGAQAQSPPAQADAGRHLHQPAYGVAGERFVRAGSLKQIPSELIL